MKISETVEFLHEVGGVMIRLTLQQVSRDLLVLLTGGDAPHVGSVIAAAPHPSLRGVGMSATSNVINRSGHYDEVPGRRVAERLAASLNAYLTAAPDD